VPSSGLTLHQTFRSAGTFAQTDPPTSDDSPYYQWYWWHDQPSGSSPPEYALGEVYGLCGLPFMACSQYAVPAATCNCVNATAYVCDCASASSGFTGTHCEQDINECAVNNGGCAPNLDCANTDGSYICGPRFTPVPNLSEHRPLRLPLLIFCLVTVGLIDH
jgi:hypothetical protein